MPPLAVQLPAAVQLIVTIAELSVEALLASTATPQLVGLELLAELLQRDGALAAPRRLLDVELLEQPHLLRRRARLALHHLNSLLVLGTLEQLRLEAPRLALEHLVEHVHPREALRAARLAQRRRHRCGGEGR